MSKRDLTSIRLNVAEVAPDLRAGCRRLHFGSGLPRVQGDSALPQRAQDSIARWYRRGIGTLESALTVLVLALAATAQIHAQGTVVQLAPEIVTAARTPQPPTQVAATVHKFEGEELRTAPSATLDGALRSVPGFSLFRRSDSLTANPTAQGVSLRGLGPSGASRSLVLLDGVPLNDPFGGWVAWSKVPREGLLGAELIPGGGATAWGNAALGGVVHVRSQMPRVRISHLTALAGDFGTRSGEVAHTEPVGAGVLLAQARVFATDGFSLVAPDRRGPIDIAAWSRHRWLSARWSQVLANQVELAATVRGYEEKRGNGTPYQQNQSREKFLSFTAAAQPSPTFAWNAVGYAQDQTFASTFSAVNATRTAETPASDQYAVPSTAFGAAWTGAWRHADARTSLGTDVRTVRGETRENFTFANGAFTRQRTAGGEQHVGGIFAVHERALTSQLRGTLGARLDAWQDGDGHRRETDRATSNVLRNDRYADRHGTAFSPSAGLVWTPAEAWRVRANAQRSFRRPTLNELYRPFRVGPNITEANEALGTERATSAELAGEWSLPATSSTFSKRSASASTQAALLTLSAALFWNDLQDAVGNITRVRGPGTYPLFGFVPAGGVGRQRLNLERSRVRGLELSAHWRPLTTATFTADYLYNEAEVTRASVAPALVGRRLAQVPRHSAALAAHLGLPGGFTVTPRVRFLGRQFEDDENQLILGAVIVGDLSVSRRLSDRLELFLTAENVGNARIETGRTADGLVNTGTPRFLLGGLRGSW